MTQPAATIMFGPKYNRDIALTSFSWVGANSSYVWSTSAFVWDSNNALPGNAQTAYLGEGANIPDGARNNSLGTPNATYPKGNRGGVSLPTSGTEQGTSDFIFTDGHAKAMNPVATNPDPVAQPQSNMWFSGR